MTKKSLNKTKKNSLFSKIQIKEKPWGKEIWFAHTKNYVGKILEVKKGHRYSLQYHEKKQETQYIFSGKVLFTMGTNVKKLQKKILHQGQKIDVTPGCIHRLEAIEDALVFEVSTPEINDVVKIEDDYGRNGKGNNEKMDKKLHNFLNKTI